MPGADSGVSHLCVGVSPFIANGAEHCWLAWSPGGQTQIHIVWPVSDRALVRSAPHDAERLTSGPPLR